MFTNLTCYVVRCFTGKLYLSRFQKSSKYFLRHQRTCTTMDYGNNSNFDYHEMKTYKEYIDERKVDEKRIIITLMKSLCISRKKALNIITEWEVFNSMTRVQIIDNINLFREEDVDQSTIRDNVYILADSTDNIKRKIDVFKDLNLEINSIIPLLRLPLFVIQIFEKRSKFDQLVIPNYHNRIHYLSLQLESDVHYLCTKLVINSFLLTMKIKKVIEVTELLIDSGMHKNYIVDDLLIYKYEVNKIKERILRAKIANIQPLRPWIVRCTKKSVLRAELRSSAKLEALSFQSLEEYISEIMECDVALVKGLLRRNPGIYSINFKKLTAQLNIFKSFGYTVNEIFYVSRIFFCNNDSLVKKYNTWIDHGLSKPSLFLLASSMSQFNEILEKELKNRELTKN